MNDKKKVLEVPFTDCSTWGESWGECPSCGMMLFIYGKDVVMNYCHYCGQALEWNTDGEDD